MSRFDFEVLRQSNLWVRIAIRMIDGDGEWIADAKIYDEPDGFGPDYNGYGIREGSRVSKLSVREMNRHQAEVISWDRGETGMVDQAAWKRTPPSLTDAVIDFLEEAPQLSSGS